MSSSGKAPTLLRYFLLIFFLILLFPALFYEIPKPGLDESWNIALNLAYRQHMVFGKDILFTYGPLGILNYRLPIAFSKFVYLLFDIYFLTTLFFILRSIFKRQFSYGLAIFIFFCIMANQYGELYQWYFFFFFFYLFSFIKAPGRIGHLAHAAVLSGLILYFKVSLGMTTIFLFLAAITYMLIRRKWNGKVYAAVLLSYFLVMWSGALFLHVSLKDYILGSLQLINGYNDAMSRPVDPEYLPFLLTAVLIVMIFLVRFGYLLVASLRRKEGARNADELLIQGFTGVAIFVLFKSAFVRLDAHAYLFFKNILLFAAFVFFYTPRGFKKKSAAICCWIVLVLSFWAVNAMPGSYQPYLRILKGSFLSYKAREMRDYFYQVGNYDSARAASDSLVSRDNDYKTIIGAHSADILPTEISTLYFNGLRYDPRPLIQSYSVYTEFLDSLNYQKYKSPGAPDYLLFSVGAIDGRVPFFDESRTKLTILERYSIVGKIKGDLVLKKKERPESLQPVKADTIFARLGEEIPVKKSPKLLFSRIFIDYNLWGRLRRFFYQPPYLRMTFTLDNGEVRTFKAIVPILADGVILNKFLETEDEFQLLMQANGRLNTDVTSIRFDSDPASTGFAGRIKMVSTSFSFPEKTVAELRADSLGLADLVGAQGRYKPELLDTSLYRRDTLRFALGNVMNRSQLLRIQDGWAFRDNYRNDHILIKAIVRSQDKVYALPTENQERPDLVAVFKKADVGNAGFKATVSKSLLPPGDYQLGILIIDTVLRKGWIDYSDRHVIVEREYRVEKARADDAVAIDERMLAYGLDPLQEDEYRVTVRGWAFLKNAGLRGAATNLILRSGKAVYRISTDSLQRIDVARTFHDPQVAFSGFSVTIPKDQLPEGIYKIGVEKSYPGARGRSLVFTGQEINIGVPEVVIPAPVAETELPPAGNFDLGIDFIKEMGDTVTLSGWAVQKMDAVDSSSIEILLKRDRFVYAAGTRTRSRHDVTTLFKSKFNLDDCGFFVKLSTKALPAGRYQVGIHVYRDGDKGIVRWLDQAIDVPK